jgi:hypothetical protein
MACKYCGKDGMLIYDNLLTGATCYECGSMLHSLMDIYDGSIKKFYGKLNELGLMISFVNFISTFKSDCKLLHFMDVKKDKRLKFIYILHFRALTVKDVPGEVEIKIVEYPDKAMLKIVYKFEKKTTELFIDKDGKFFAGETKDFNMDMSWVAKEFADLK